MKLSPLLFLSYGSLLLALLFPGVLFAGAATAGTSPLTTAILKAYGGTRALAAVEGVIASGRIDDDLRHLTGSYRRIMRRPGALRIEIRLEQGGEIRILDGENGWQGSAAADFAPAKEIALASMRYQYAYLDLPYCLADGSCRTEAGGIQELGGVPYDLLLIAVTKGPQLRVYVDRQSHLIYRVAAELSLGSMGSSELATEYADYRPVQGVLFPHLLTNFAEGSKISRLTLESIVVNAPLSPGIFAPPGTK